MPISMPWVSFICTWLTMMLRVCSQLEECPICFLYYPALNRAKCCSKGVCTECFLQVSSLADFPLPLHLPARSPEATVADGLCAHSTFLSLGLPLTDACSTCLALGDVSGSVLVCSAW